MPSVSTADGVKGDIHGLARERQIFFNEILIAIIDGGTAQVETADTPRNEQVPYISNPLRRPSCNSAASDSARGTVN